MNERIKPEHLTRARKAAGLSMAQAAILLEITRPALARIEEGITPLSASLREKMLAFYDVSPHYLETGEPQTFTDHLADGAPEEVILKMAKDSGGHVSYHRDNTS